MQNPHKLLLRLLIAVIVIALCMALYPLFYCRFVSMC
jgi:hypothetical protein